MTKKLPEYDHMVEIKEDEKKIYVFRIYKKSKKKQLFTCYELPAKSFDEDKKAFQEFAKILGGNLLIDSPTARKLFGI